MTNQRTLLIEQTAQALPPTHALLAFDERVRGFFRTPITVFPPEVKEFVGAPATFHSPGVYRGQSVYFNAALGLDFLERNVDDRQALYHLKEVLKGPVLIGVPCADTARGLPPRVYRQYSMPDLVQVVVRAGYRIEEVLAKGPELCIVQATPNGDLDFFPEMVGAIDRKDAEKLEQLVAVERTCVEKDPVLMRECLLILGEAYLVMGAPESAFDMFNYALRYRCPGAYIGMGTLALNSSDTEAAMELFTEALRLDPCSFTALHGLGETQKCLGRYEDAAVSFGKAATLRPIDKNIADKTLELAVRADNYELAYQTQAQYLRAIEDDRYEAKWRRIIAPTGNK